jgi:hypothetical protein
VREIVLKCGGERSPWIDRVHSAPKLRRAGPGRTRMVRAETPVPRERVSQRSVHLTRPEKTATEKKQEKRGQQTARLSHDSL